MAQRLRAASLDRLDHVEAAAAVGAFSGAIIGASLVLPRDRDCDLNMVCQRLAQATTIGLRPCV
jgi:hypothetical protein